MKDDAELQKEIRRQSLEALLEIADRHSASDIGEGADLPFSLGMATAAYKAIAKVAGREAAVFAFGQALMEPWLARADRDPDTQAAPRGNARKP
jgi:hypothetical protein